jgi:murein L,D-transpeptidase YcbB/YkuD
MSQSEKFGPKTETPSKHTRSHGLSRDGVAGPLTVAKLFYAPVQADRLSAM